MKIGKSVLNFQIILAKAVGLSATASVSLVITKFVLLSEHDDHKRDACGSEEEI